MVGMLRVDPAGVAASVKPLKSLVANALYHMSPVTYHLSGVKGSVSSAIARRSCLPPRPPPPASPLRRSLCRLLPLVSQKLHLFGCRLDYPQQPVAQLGQVFNGCGEPVLWCLQPVAKCSRHRSPPRSKCSPCFCCQPDEIPETVPRYQTPSRRVRLFALINYRFLGHDRFVTCRARSTAPLPKPR